ncbi:Retinoic Acid Receptor Responder Protein 2 [Manis pentadactyla]|nr:Retinoic Acid Receptor Responder Protein 2 [Manis pentadactyla]
MQQGLPVDQMDQVVADTFYSPMNNGISFKSASFEGDSRVRWEELSSTADSRTSWPIEIKLATSASAKRRDWNERECWSRSLLACTY